MGTGRSVTVSYLGGCIPEEIFGGKKIRKKIWIKKKIWINPPQKIGDPPEKLEAPPGPDHPPTVNRILDTRLWKYYLGPTSLRPVTVDR